MIAGSLPGEKGVAWEMWRCGGFVPLQTICNLTVTREKIKEREDLGAFPIHIPNAVGLEVCVLVYFVLSHPCV